MFQSNDAICLLQNGCQSDYDSALVQHNIVTNMQSQREELCTNTYMIIHKKLYLEDNKIFPEIGEMHFIKFGNTTTAVYSCFSSFKNITVINK